MHKKGLMMRDPLKKRGDLLIVRGLRIASQRTGVERDSVT